MVLKLSELPAANLPWIRSYQLSDSMFRRYAETFPREFVPRWIPPFVQPTSKVQVERTRTTSCSLILPMEAMSPKFHSEISHNRAPSRHVRLDVLPSSSTKPPGSSLETPGRRRTGG